ncbi:hypothetical protein HRS9122_00004 [Pyrenophora teres f. teres]|nr:hypothetical protein HRS9122_00004 [Pyrenophora teres f. teres]
MFTRRFEQPDAHFKTSSRWHRALTFSPAPEDFDPGMGERAARSAAIQVERESANLLKLLQANFGSDAQFRGLQKSVLEAIMAGEPVVAYVAGTGSGKSLMFMLPACFPGYGQIIVVLPLGALRLDILSRCEELRIQASIWRAGGFNESASIVLVSPENLGHADFPSYVRRQKALGRLEMIVMDEIHYIILPDQAYRPSLLNLQDIMQYSVRTVFMTATLPVCEQREAFRLLGLPSDTVAFRELTSRPNIQYTVTYVGSTKRWSTEKMAEIPNVFFEKADEKTRGRVEDYVQLVRQKPECRRRVLDRYFDGNKTRKMCVPPEEPCDLCAGEYYASSCSNHIRRVGGVVSHKSRMVNKDLEDAVPTQSDSQLPMPLTPVPKGDDVVSTPQGRGMMSTRAGGKTPTALLLPSRDYGNGESIGGPSGIGFSSASREEKLHKRNYSQVASPTSSRVDEASPSVRSYKASRQERTLDFHAQSQKAKAQLRAKVFQEQIPRTLEF